MAETNQTPEQIARDQIDRSLEQAGWVVQSNKKIYFSAGRGIAIKEYQTDIGLADYALFVDKKPVGGIEAKLQDWGQKITTDIHNSRSLINGVALRGVSCNRISTWWQVSAAEIPIRMRGGIDLVSRGRKRKDSAGH